MKNKIKLALLPCLALAFSVNAWAQNPAPISKDTPATAGQYCFAGFEEPGYGSIWGDATYQVTCDGKERTFQRAGCYSDSCMKKYRATLEANQLKDLKEIGVFTDGGGSELGKTFVYATAKAPAISPENYEIVSRFVYPWRVKHAPGLPAESLDAVSNGNAESFVNATTDVHNYYLLNRLVKEESLEYVNRLTVQSDGDESLQEIYIFKK